MKNPEKWLDKSLRVAVWVASMAIAAFAIWARSANTIAPFRAGVIIGASCMLAAVTGWGIAPRRKETADGN